MPLALPLSAACLIFTIGLATFVAADRQAAPAAPQATQAAAADGDEALARATCGTCHAFPPPDILPRGVWRDEFVRMMFIREGRQPPVGRPEVVYRTVQLPPDFERVLPFYTSRAPERLAAPEPWPDPGESPVKVTRRALSVADMPDTPAVSNVRLVDFDGDKHVDILGTDMRQGVVFSGRATGTTLSVVASIPHPAHVTLADLDGDGTQDLLIGDLGEFFPADHDQGAVIWMRGLANRKFGAFWLDGWPRVADVESADFNGDGKNDLAVAAFGWRKTGQVAILTLRRN